MSSSILQSKSKQSVISSPSRFTPQTSQRTSPAPTHDAIARRAYEIYINHGSQQGHCSRNWHQAEHELRNAAGETFTSGEPRGHAARSLEGESTPESDTIPGASSSRSDPFDGAALGRGGLQAGPSERKFSR